LIKVLQNQENSARKEAALALGELGDERAVEFLVQALEDESIRENAFIALATIGANKGKEVLVNAFREESGTGVRKSVLKAIEQVSDSVKRMTKAKQPLEDYEWIIWLLKYFKRIPLSSKTVLETYVAKRIKHTTELVRSPYGAVKLAAIEISYEFYRPLLYCLGDREIIEALITAFVEIGDGKSVKPLIKALGNSNRKLYKRALKEIGKFKDINVAMPFKQALNDESKKVQKVVKEALRQIKKM